jgi:hypothetical protein
VSDTPSATFRTSSGLPVSLSVAEYRLALLGTVDFASDWDALELATTFVPDGPAKLALIQERLRPLAGYLSPLTQRVDALELLAARHWFRRGAVSEVSHEEGST